MGLAWALTKCQNRQELNIKHLRDFPLLSPLALANLYRSLTHYGDFNWWNFRQPKKCRSYLLTDHKSAAIIYHIAFIETWMIRQKQSSREGSAAGVSPGTPWENGGSQAGFSIGMLTCYLSWSHGTPGGCLWTGSRRVWKLVPGQGTCLLCCLCPTFAGQRIFPARRLIRSSTGGGSAWMWLTSHPQRFLSGSQTDSWRSEVQNIVLKFS